MSKGKVRVPKDEKNTRASSRVISLVVVVAIIVLWYLVTKIGSANQLFLPSPGAVWAAFINILHNGYKSISLWQHLGSSMYRMLVAFALATVIAVPLGLASGYIPQLKAILEPIVEFIRPLPPLAYYTLLVLWLGIDNGSKIVLLLIACFMPIYITCVAAVIKIPSNYLHNAASLGANKAQIFFRVVFPYSLPDIFLGMRTAIGVGFTTLVAAEMV
ncbi:MAG: ABC transporter permease, partial [Coriobacteriia bacterium]|nr:ABC transporter permease [Coriobacteriia bacterium]